MERYLPFFKQYDMFIYTYRVVLLSIVITFFSCTDDKGNGEGPAIRFLVEEGIIATDTIISPSALMKFGIEAEKGDFDITELYVQVTNDNCVQKYFDSGMYVSNLKWYGSFIKSYNDNEIWEFVVRDRYSHESSVFLMIKNDTLGSPGEIDSFQEVILGAQNNNEFGGFWDLFNNHVFPIQEAKQNQELIDIVYYLGEDDHTLGSPGANIEDGIFDPEYTPTNWAIQNETRYIPLDFTVEDFNQIENDSILIVNYIEGEGKRKAKNLQAGDVFSFKTADLRFGMVKVDEVVGGAEGTVSIDIKIQKGEEE